MGDHRRKFSDTLLLCLALQFPVSAGVQISTRSTIPDVSAAQLQRFLATPDRWPQIVASSWAVEPGVAGRKGRTGAIFDTATPLRKGDEVREIFGLPPLVPLEVIWSCIENTPGCLDVFSDSGLSGVAENCRMKFTVRDTTTAEAQSNAGGTARAGAAEQAAGAEVELIMSYDPLSPIARLAAPALTLDNALALKVLLPRAIATASTSSSSSLAAAQSAVQASVMPQEPTSDLTLINQFRRLMGTLYGIAGAAHVADLLSDNRLLAAAGLPAFTDLPLQGQAAAVAWCIAGFVAFAATRVPAPHTDSGVLFTVADLGLVTYGVVEVGCALLAVAFVHATGAAPATDLDPVVNALGVQVAVLGSWVYSNSKTSENMA